MNSENHVDLFELGEWHRSQSSGVQAKFADALKRLFHDGVLLRDEGADASCYATLVRYLSYAQAYFEPLGLALLHHERLHVLQLQSQSAALHRSFDKETTIWALLCRLIYAEKKESETLSLAHNPLVLAGDLFLRYAEFFPGKNLRKKTAAQLALSTLAGAKILRIHSANAAAAKSLDPDARVELLPTLEVLMPSSNLQEIAHKLQALGGAAQEKSNA